ncbi:MAG: diguanylate cyclase [Desulfovibrionaceae bacterium]
MSNQTDAPDNGADIEVRPETGKPEAKRAARRQGDAFWRQRLLRLIHPDRWSLRGRFVYASGVLLLLGVVTTIFFVAHAMHRSLETALADRLDTYERWLSHEIRGLEDGLALQAAAAVALPGVSDALARGDRAALEGALTPALERIRLGTGHTPPPLQFYDAEGKPLFNTWTRSGGSDDPGWDAGMAAAALHDLTPLAGLQVQSTGPRFAAVIPVLADGRAVGAVEAVAGLDELFAGMALPPEYGLVVALDPKAAERLHESAARRPLAGLVVTRAFGGADLHDLAAAAGNGPLPSAVGTVRLRAVRQADYRGQSVGQALLTYDAARPVGDVEDRLFMLGWLAVGGAAFLWLVLYINVKRIQDFLTRMKKVIIASHSTDFSERLETDTVHCLEVLQCRNKECPVYQDPTRVCYLETGDEAISPRWRGTCIFLNKYKTCAACPVYRLRHGDELMEMRHVLNTMMRLWSLFLGRIGRLLSEVLRTERAGRVSLDEVSGYLEAMARLTSYSHDLQGVYDRSEVYRQLEHVFEESFGISRFALLEEDSEKRMSAVLDRMPPDALHPEVLVNSELCRARRVAEDVISAQNPVLCPYFNINTATHVRCCLPMVMGGRVGAVFTFVLSRAQWEANKRSLVILKKYLEETAPTLSSLRLLELTKEQSLRDPLTHCHNRRFLDEYLSQVEHLAERMPRRIGFIMADLDHFKMVNDEHGHQAGDQILRQVVRIMRENIRRADLLVRYGGEEFLVLLAETSQADAAEHVAEKIRAAVETADLAIPSGARLKKTISLGVAVFPDDADQLYRAIKYADVALYQAKENGRNRVVRFLPEMWKDEDGY